MSEEYDEDNYEEEMGYSVSEMETSKKNPSFETLTAADIIILMNTYIENVKTIVEVKF